MTKVITEKMIQTRRITREDIDACIVSVHYATPVEGAKYADITLSNEESSPLPALPKPLSMLIFCVIVLTDGTKYVSRGYWSGPLKEDEEFARKGALEELIWRIGDDMEDELYLRLKAIKAAAERHEQTQ